jgi:hypothetical protein
VSEERFSTQQQVLVTGLYRVTHGAHRLPHEALLLAGERFPRCAKCSDQVQFELLAATPGVELRSQKIARVYELPVLEDDDAAPAVAS